MMDRKKVIVIFGPPGVGKSTVSNFISEKFKKAFHLNFGSILRKLSQTDRRIAVQINEGKLLSDELINEVANYEVKEWLDRNNSSTFLLIDGYPRTLKQALFLNRLIEKNNDSYCICLFVFNLRARTEVIFYRLSNRRMCNKCGAIYLKRENIENDKCKRDGNKLVVREDDKLRERIRRRVEEYNKQTLPILSFYKRDNVSIFNLDLNRRNDFKAKVLEIVENDLLEKRREKK